MNVCPGPQELYNSKHMDMNPIQGGSVSHIQYLVYLSNHVAMGQNYFYKLSIATIIFCTVMKVTEIEHPSDSNQPAISSLKHMMSVTDYLISAHVSAQQHYRQQSSGYKNIHVEVYK